MWRNNWILTIAVCVVAVLSLSCGGGANDDPPSSTVLLTVDLDANEGAAGDLVAAEMIKDVGNTTALINIRAATSTDTPVDPTVGLITLRRYRITFERIDGGSPNLPPVEGAINESIEVRNITTSSGITDEANEDVVVVPTSAKLFSEFGQAFQQNPSPVAFNATLTLFADNRAGQNLERTMGFRVTCGVFNGTDGLEPNILSFTESKNLQVGDPYRAFWNTEIGRPAVRQASLILPWGPELSIPSNQFPFGGTEVDTSVLANQIAPGSSAPFPPGQLFVFNAFGSANATAGSEAVTVSAPSPGGNSISIDQYFADRDTVNLGESVTLNYSISGGPDRLQMLPSSFNGVPVDFTGRSLSFDSIEITPTISVNPLLRAEKNDGSFAEAFLSSSITVNAPNAGGPPEIVVFSASRDNVPVGSQIVLFWNVQGTFSKIELFPINGSRLDVTDRTSVLVPPVNLEGSQLYTLVVTGTDGSIVPQSIPVNYTSTDNVGIDVTQITQAPSRMPNGGNASFDFLVEDEERQDSTWRVRRIAGERASHFPTEGRIPDGFGDASIAVSDGADFSLGYVVFEVSAWDDDLFGLSPTSTRDVELVTFDIDDPTVNTPDNAVPTIDEGPVFIEAGDSPDDSVPGVEGVIAFAFSDEDTQTLEWSIRIIGGDFGGDLTPNSGLVDTGEGDIAVQYRDDPDTPDDPVIFEIRVAERNVANPQRDIAVLRHDKGTTTVGGGGGGGSTSGPISLGFDGLYANLFGGVQETQVIRDYVLFFPGTGSGNITFYRNSDLSGEVDGASVIFDFAHNTSDPGRISDADYSRNFLGTGAIDNTGDLSFSGYFANAGANTASTSTPIANGVSRWFMPFNVNSFQESGGSYNLPASGQTFYNITVTVTDADTSTATFNRALTVIVP